MKTMDRRTILKSLKALLLFLIAPVLEVKEVIADAFPTRTIELDTFSFDPPTGMIAWARENRTEPYHLVVDGLVAKPVKLTYPEVRGLPATEQVSDFHCVEGWTIPQVRWAGFRFKELLNLVQPLEGADFVVFHSLGETRSRPRGQKHYIESFALADLLDLGQEILLVLEKDGKPLSLERGAPLRVIAPPRLGYKSIKFVHRVEFVREPKPGWWTLANPIYDWDAKVPLSRLRNR